MVKLNTRTVSTLETHEAGKAIPINAELQLRRSVMACMLWEKQFYEDGESIADRIASTIPHVKPEIVCEIAIEAREKMKLRHVPLLITREMARINSHKYLVGLALSRIIQRPDELSEFLAIYWKDGRQPLSAQVKKGLSKAFTKFDAYQLAKYNRDGQVKLRDVLFLSHAKPQDKEQESMWKQLVNGSLPSPDTWEVRLSAGADKKASFEALIRENKLGALALLRNLRNMNEAGVDKVLVANALENIKVERVLPFRFITAARYVPQWENNIEKAMMKCLSNTEKSIGDTVLLIDVSGSMESGLSDKSELTRMDAACGVAILAREMYDNVRVFTFSEGLVEVPPRHGFALRDSIVQSQPHSSTYLGQAVSTINQHIPYDRFIVITDEQAHDTVPMPKSKGYMINVASYENGVGYRQWIHIDGFSEAVLNYIRTIENSTLK